MIATALYTGLRTSELLALIWSDIDLRQGQLHVTAQLSRAHRGQPAKRVAPKTRAAVRDIPLAPQLVDLLTNYRGWRDCFEASWVFGTGKGTPLGHRNVERRALRRAAEKAGLEAASSGTRASPRRSTSTPTWSPRPATPSTCGRRWRAAFADLLQRADEENEEGGAVITLPRPAEKHRKPLSAREKAALRWAT